MNIKKKIKESNLKQWQIAEAMGISEFTLSRWLRRPEKLDKDKKEKIEAAIRNIKKGV